MSIRHTRNCLPRPLLALTVLLLALTGCGGGGSGSGEQNRAPTVRADDFVGDEDTIIRSTITASDPDGDAVQIQIARSPDNGTLSLSSDGNVQYTPRADFYGQDRFSVAANDGKLSSAATEVTIEVASIDDPPEFKSSRGIAATEDTAARGQAKFEDPEGKSVVVTLIEQPQHGTFSLLPNGEYEYTPDANFNGQDSVVISAADETTTTRVELEITVRAVNDAPVLKTISALSLDEDTVTTGTYLITDVDGPDPRLVVQRAPAHGTLRVLDPTTFEYEPQRNFAGADDFEIAASDGALLTDAVRVQVTVHAVDHPPVLPNYSDITNSSETLQTRLAIPLRDADDETLVLTATSDTLAVATAAVDLGRAELVLTPLTYGEATIVVSASDGKTTATKSFKFSVEDVTKRLVMSNGPSTPNVIDIRNTSEAAVDFSLRHNGSRLLTSVFEILDDVRDQQDAFEGEPFESKLWRYVRDNVYHALPLSSQVFGHEPLLLVNSIGYGLCDDVATIYMHLAKAAGYDSRVWYLEGHVVPEILVGARWSMYDPDLSVYYTDSTGQVLGVEELQTNTAFITNPNSPVLPLYRDGYSAFVASIYGSAVDNQLADVLVPYLMVPQTPQSGLLTLPPGASLEYPGRWVAPASVPMDGPLPPYHATYSNMRLSIPAGQTGIVRLPLQVLQISGTGTIAIDGVSYELGSDQLKQRLTEPTLATRQLTITAAASEITVYMMLNPLRFGRRTNDEIELTGKDVWTLDVTETATAAGQVVLESNISSFRKPTG